MTAASSFRWGDYFLRGDDQFCSFWQELVAAGERKILFVIGHGFDRRMCDCAESILGIGGDGVRDAVVIEYDEGPASPSRSYLDQRDENGRRLESVFNGRGTITRRAIEMYSDDGRRVGARSIANEFSSLESFRIYSDVVVDISALPRGLYFPLLSKLLSLFDHDSGDKQRPNLHVVVAHSPALDQCVIDEGVEESASFLHGFAAASFEREATKEQPRIWIPLLGRNQVTQLERIYELINPDEICPLLPSPSRRHGRRTSSFLSIGSCFSTSFELNLRTSSTRPRQTPSRCIVN